MKWSVGLARHDPLPPAPRRPPHRPSRRLLRGHDGRLRGRRRRRVAGRPRGSRARRARGRRRDHARSRPDRERGGGNRDCPRRHRGTGPGLRELRPTKTPRPGAGCSVTTVPPLNQSGLVCSLAAAQAIRIDWSGAVAPAIARPGTVDPNGPRTGVTAGTGSLPVAVQGGASAEQMTVPFSGPVTVNAGDGDDRLNVISPKATVDAGAGNDILSLGQGPVAQGRAPWRVDAGTGDDAVLTGGIPDDSVVIGGPGDDRLDVATENTDGKTAISRQRVDCGDGADTAGIDARDVLGPACGPAPRAERRDMTAGRFAETGSIRVSPGRLSAPAGARVSLTGPRPPALSATTTNGLRGYTAAPKLLPRTEAP